MRYLTLEQILRLHFEIINDFGGSHGVRDEGRLRAVVAAPALAVFGETQYTTLCEKAAVYARNIIGDHPFVDGNKRTGITCMVIFLKRNGYDLNVPPDQLEDFAVQIAVEHLTVAQITKWLKAHSS